MRRAGAVRQQRLRGHLQRAQGRPRVPQAREDTEVRGRLPRDTRLLADEPRARSGNTPYPQAEPSSAGIPRAIQETVLVAPFNDLNAVEDILDRYHNEIAAVIVEPVQRVIAPQPGFLPGLRELTNRYGVLLIYDEVVTGFRLAYGGAQEYFNAVPDIAAIGKIVGGGFPLAAIVGQARDHGVIRPGLRCAGCLRPAERHAERQSRRRCSRTRDSRSAPRAGNLYEAYHARAATLRNTLQRLFDEAEVPAQVSGVDMMFDVYFTEQPISRLPLDARGQDAQPGIRQHDAGPRHPEVARQAVRWSVCHSDDDIERTIEAFRAGRHRRPRRVMEPWVRLCC